MANNPNRDSSFHEVPTYEYIFISGVAIHKRFFKYYTFTLTGLVGVSVTIACLTDWWLILASALLQYVFIRAWYVSFPALAITSVVTYVWYKRRKMRLFKENMKREREEEYKDAVIDTNKRVKQNKKAGVKT